MSILNTITVRTITVRTIPAINTFTDNSLDAKVLLSARGSNDARYDSAHENADAVASAAMHCRAERLPPANGDVTLVQVRQRLAAASTESKAPNRPV